MSVEQRTAIKFCVLNGKKTEKKLWKYWSRHTAMLQCRERHALHKWYSRYEKGYESVMDEQRSGRPTSITSQKVQEIKEILVKARRITVREVSQRIESSVGTVHTIIQENLNMRRLCARWIPKKLSECQKAQRVESCLRFVQPFKREGKDFLSRIVTADETWISLYEPESKEQSTMWILQGLHHQRNLKSVVQRRNRCSSCSSTSTASSLAMPFRKDRRSQQITTQR